MPSDFPRSPKMLKGALVVFQATIPIPTNLIVFQYNPETLTRSFQRQSGGSDPRTGSGDTQNVVLPPVESFQVNVELNATDQLESGDPIAGAVGLHPTLAALELLIYPSSTSLILNKVLSLAGSAAITPASTPLVLFVWGPMRMVPVFVTSVSITEQAFDTLLNPIRARVGLSLRALTYPELKQAGGPFEALGVVNLVAKEVLSKLAIVNSVQQIGGSLSL